MLFEYIKNIFFKINRIFSLSNSIYFENIFSDKTIKSDYMNNIYILFELNELFDVSFLKKRAKFCIITLGFSK